MSKFTSEQNKEFWNEYAKKHKDNPFGAHSDKHVVDLENRFITSELESRKTISLLDIGCGNGQRTLLFSKYVAGKTLGIDYSYTMIDEAKTLLSKQEEKTRNNVSFEVLDINDFSMNAYFDTIISCRCFINQTSYENQVKLFELLYSKLNPKGSLIIAEQSLEGIERLNVVRNKFGLGPIKIAWHNLPINEQYVFSKINTMFNVKKINRLGIFYYISRIIHPALVYPDEPQPLTKINELGLQSEILLQNELEGKENPFEKFGAQLLVHFTKK